MKGLSRALDTDCETMPILRNWVFPSQIRKGTLELDNAMRFTIDSSELPISLSINDDFNLFNPTRTPVAITSSFILRGVGIIGLRNNIEVTVETITVAIHADKGEIEITDFRIK